MRGPGAYFNDKMIPEFDPDVSNLTAAQWLETVDDLGIMYGWPERRKLYMSGCRLKGNAELWFHEMRGSRLSWQAFNLALKQQFPGRVAFGEALKEAVDYMSAPGQDLLNYCYLKIGKIKRTDLDLTQKQLVEYVVQGIHDVDIRTTIQASSCKTVPELNEKLTIFRTRNTDKEKRSKSDVNVQDKSRELRDNKNKGDKDPASSRGRCYTCGKRGHKQRFCLSKKLEQPSDEKRNDDKGKSACSYCNKLGHGVEKCFKREKDEKSKKP